MRVIRDGVVLCDEMALWHWISCLEKRPSTRNAEDIDIIYTKLKTLKLFGNYPDEVLLELSRYAVYTSFLGKVTLYRPGEEGHYWYAVLSGTLEMLDVDTNDSDKTSSICFLKEGDSFGESAIFGKTRQTMIVTCDFTELLCVEAIQMKRIYEAHKDLMDKLFGLKQEATEAVKEEVVDDGSEEESELMTAGATLVQLIKDHFAELMSDQRVNMYTYKNCCSGRRLVDWVISQSATTRSRSLVIGMWQALLTEGVLQHVLKEHDFKDDPQIFYQFVEHHRKRRAATVKPSSSVSSQDGTSKRARSASSADRCSVSSLLDECFDTIAHLGPEAMLYAVLAKSPADRTEEDQEFIYEELQNVRAFGHLSNAVKKALAACVKLECHPKAGKYLFHQGDKGDSWYIILKGSVNVMIGGKGIVCTLHEGDEFGKLALINEGVRSASVQLREDNCRFLKIERQDFKRILLSVESSTVKLKEHGREVLILEKTGLGRYLVVKGTPEKMLEHLLDEEINLAESDTFAHDFFLTCPAFMSIAAVCEGLLNHYQNTSAGATQLSPEQQMERKEKVAKAVSLWIRTAGAELVKDQVFLKLLKALQDRMSTDKLEAGVKLLTEALSESMRPPTTSSLGSGLPSKMQMLKKKTSTSVEPEIKMGICMLPPCQPQDKIPIRVHTLEHTCCRLQVRLDATAKSIVEEACEKLHLPADKYELCEVKSAGEKVVLKESDVSVHSELSVNGRLFAIPRGHPDKILPPLQDQVPTSIPEFPEHESSREIAAHLTIYDWNLFCNVQQMEFIYQIFGRHKFGKITTNLDHLLQRFNQIQYWVITELCREMDLQKRGLVLRKFVKIAEHCKNFNNLNSFFAIVVGLINGTVSRLHQTWKDLPPKYRRKFESFESLMDPSRNHKVLRAYQSKLLPPVVPFMPLIMKDSFFLHEGNASLSVDGLVNFEKMRLVAEKVRGLCIFRQGSLSQELKTHANKNPSLQFYIRELKVIDNDQTLAQLSHKAEPPRPLSL